MKASNQDQRQLFFFFGLLSVAIFLYAVHGWADEVKIVRINESNVARVLVSMRGTVLSFPAKPTKVILGRTGSFGIEYVENDLAISPLSLSSRSNLFVYLFGRRFAFDLVASPTAGASVIQVRDSVEKPVKALK